MNGNGNMIALLERIANGQEAANEHLDRLGERVDRMGEMLGARIDETNQRLDQINQRLDHVIEFMGAHHADHELRIRALEGRVFVKSG